MFQRNQSKPVGGVEYTRYLLLEGGQKDGWKDGKLNTMSVRFSSKKWGTKKVDLMTPPLGLRACLRVEYLLPCRCMRRRL